jgi:hypothetical protein
MSVIVTIRVSADPASFEEHLRSQADTLGRTLELAKRHGVIAHRWYAGDGEVLVADEWPDSQSFQTFFSEAQSDIGPFLEAAGVTAPPEVRFWRVLDTQDTFGWGA